MCAGPSSGMSNRHLNRGEIIIVYEVMTNPYDWNMSQNLPFGDFRENKQK